MARAHRKEDHLIVMKESELHEGRARIKVVGCGGGGGNAVNRMISKALKVQFIAVNTDKQALERCQADIKVQIGNKITRGLGAGGDWTRGRDAADESRTELSAVVQESDMVFITAAFADVRAIRETAGGARRGLGHGAGDSRAEDAAKQGVSSPLLETSIDGAKGILFNITAGKDITLQEVQKAAEIVRSAADPGANIIFGVVRDDTMAGEIKITDIATGFGGQTQQDARQVKRQETTRRTIERPEFGLEELGDINIPAFLRNRG